MYYFCGINNLTALQEKRINLLQNHPSDAARINSEFMQAKDTIIGKRKTSEGQQIKRLPRITYSVEIINDDKSYAELCGNCIVISPPPYHAFNAEFLSGKFELPKVTTPATMAFFIPPLTPVPIYSFT